MHIRLSIICCILILWAAPSLSAQEEEEPEDQTEEYAASLEGEPIDPNHRFNDDLTDHPARFYVWYGDEGWHLRSTARRNRVGRFTGTITVEGGTFERIRAIGFERQGRYVDSLKVSSGRTKIEFTILTGHSFDGIDLTVDGTDATLTFEELTIGERVHRDRIFVGRDGQHPEETTFSFPAQP